MKQKISPLKGTFGIMKFSKSTEEILRELDEEERKNEARKLRMYRRILNRK